MLQETGEVREVRKGRAVVLIRRGSACGACAARGACLTFGSNERIVEVRDPVGAVVGDRVAIGIPPANVVWASLVAYVLPVIMMIGGALLGLELAPEGVADEGAAIGGFSALLLSFLGLFIYDRTRSDRVEKMPVLLSIADGASGGDGLCDVDVDRGEDVE